MFKHLFCAATAMAVVIAGAPAHAEKYPKIGKDVVFTPVLSV
jgi:hypothetical protein